MSPLNLIYVKYFCDAVRFGSIAASAKANFVTQSAISQGIAKLENSLRISLLAHHPNRFRLTPEGESLFIMCSRKGEFHFKELMMKFFFSLD